jgi:hypothetical protein
LTLEANWTAAFLAIERPEQQVPDDQDLSIIAVVHSALGMMVDAVHAWRDEHARERSVDALRERDGGVLP